jgi:hypothetical protein
MRREFPAHPLWTDPVFARDDHQTFTKDVELSLLEVEEPEEVQIRKTLPATSRGGVRKRVSVSTPSTPDSTIYSRAALS